MRPVSWNIKTLIVKKYAHDTFIHSILLTNATFICIRYLYIYIYDKYIYLLYIYIYIYI